MRPTGSLQRALILLSCTTTLFVPGTSAVGAAEADVTAEGQDEPQLEAFHADTVQAILIEATVITTVNTTLASTEPDSAAAAAPCVFPFEQCSPRHGGEKERLLLRLSRKQGTWDANHPRWRLLKTLDGFASYGRVNRAEVKRWRDMYAHVPQGQKAILEAATNYKSKLNTIEHHIATNAALAGRIAAHAMHYYGVSQRELNDFIRAEEVAGRGSERHSVVQALKHYVRDWSLEGGGERDAAFPCILAALEGVHDGRGQREEEKKKALKVLLPGSGLGRLGHEVANLGEDFEVTINEWSTYMIAAYRFVEANLSPAATAQDDAAAAAEISFHPFIDSLSHHASNDNLFRKIALSPLSSHFSSTSSADKQASSDNIFHPSRVLLVEGDFTTVFSQSQHQQQQYDIIVTHFFIDTARNLLSYISTIHALLTPGTGRWINFGPLLYGTGPWVQLSLDEVVAVSEGMGFEFEDLPSSSSSSSSSSPPSGQGSGGGGYKEGQHVCGLSTFPRAGGALGKVRGRYAGYGFDELALTRNAYQAQAWVARKK
ncbi:carnosine N-methyltransferase [Microdochium nivale]|nr:carnosine N-methyltransferase [Microdochium nivale]